MVHSTRTWLVHTTRNGHGDITTSSYDDIRTIGVGSLRWWIRGLGSIYHGSMDDGSHYDGVSTPLVSLLTAYNNGPSCPSREGSIV